MKRQLSQLFFKSMKFAATNKSTRGVFKKAMGQEKFAKFMKKAAVESSKTEIKYRRDQFKDKTKNLVKREKKEKN